MEEIYKAKVLSSTQAVEFESEVALRMGGMDKSILPPAGT
jgi:hypothetical protein